MTNQQTILTLARVLKCSDQGDHSQSAAELAAGEEVSKQDDRGDQDE